MVHANTLTSKHVARIMPQKGHVPSRTMRLQNWDVVMHSSIVI